MLFPVLLIGVAHWLIPSLVPPTVPFGVRVPRDRADAPVVAGWRRRYRAGAAVVTVLAAAAVLLVSGPVTGPAAVGGELVAGLVLYLLARHRITAVKSAEGWFDGRRQVTVADTSLRTDPERYPWPWAVPSILLTAATAVIGIVDYPRLPSRLPTHFRMSGHPDHYAARSVVTAFGPVLVQALLTVLLLAMARAALRSRAQLDAEDPQAGVRHRGFVSAIARALLVMAGCLNLAFLLLALRTWSLIGGGRTIAVGVPALTLLATVALLTVAAHVGQGGSRLRLPDRTGRAPGDGRRGAPVNRDDDRLYRLGLFYYNRDDPALFVPKRFGIGWTVNMARPLAWALLAATLAVAAAAPLLGR
ncbi:DUF1648 domain-containing protein [Actinoallomurus soli]|uniref:DUF1648 domain-containing protein n=1 Tax=Actinoallomurus soli TaxID=2952535 RepID=UPI00209361B3|nr:DUF5808 domain-containing protein [Actinoallomurus soli]MCO5969612.1 DUF5808 domain-containing protein [Actinoallomurus soli]